MTSTLNFDPELAQRLQSVYATPDVAATRIAAFKAATPRINEIALDLGCGPGYLTRELAIAVGPRGRVLGLDLSEAMLHLAKQRCAGLDQVKLENADACELPIENGTVGLACILQVYC